MPAALIQPNFEFLSEWAKRHKIELASNQQIVEHPQVVARYQEEVDLANAQFAQWEKVKAFRLTPDIWTVEDGHLTPTMKLKRKIIIQKYGSLYSDIYGHPPE